MNPSPCSADYPARILIVDDERPNRQLLEVMLAPEGFLLLTAASGEEALAIAAEQPPDLILLDIMMPRLDGYQVAASLKGNPATRDIPVIIVTALDDHKARMLVLSAGAEDFLTKPVDRAELCMRVRNLLRLKAYRDYHDKHSQVCGGEADTMEAIGRLASGVAHDFNNVLTVILGFTELVTADVDMDSQLGKDIGEITLAARRATGLTRQLLAFSGQQVLHAAPLDLNGLITGMTGMLGRLIGEQIEVALDLAPNLSLALADPGQLEQVVIHLVVNARDAMPGGGSVTIETTDVELESSSFHDEAIVPGPYVMLAITDTGDGMSRETRQHLFEPFFTTRETGKGAGLGLSTAYGIVKQSNGYIRVDSEPGRGTTFKVFLPRSNRDAPVQEFTAAVAAPVGSALETVLLVEDEAGVRHLSKRILDTAGYRVFEAANGDEAEKVFARHADSIDLVVTDVIMPGCGGPELLRRLHVRTPALRVLYMSGYTEQSAAHALGFDRGLPFVQKPFTAAEFVRQVRVALDR